MNDSDPPSKPPTPPNQEWLPNHVLKLDPFRLPPLFPTNFTVRGKDGVNVQITLHSDGTWTGNFHAFASVLPEMEGTPTQMSLILWLLARELARDVH